MSGVSISGVSVRGERGGEGEREDRGEERALTTTS